MIPPILLLSLLLLGLSSAQENCTHADGEVYAYGSTFPAGDGCNECACLMSGNIACTEMWCGTPEPRVPTPAPETLPPELVQCAYGMMLVDVGYTFTEGCSDCTCQEDGALSCVEDQPCCLYLDQEGNTARVTPGQHYSDGCNQCTCMALGGDDGESAGSACTRMACPQKCQYKNWDGVWGYSAEADGQYVAVFDEEYEEDYGCPKFCRCVMGEYGRGAEIDCRTDSGDVEPCVYF